jgi:hypothetical protein
MCCNTCISCICAEKTAYVQKKLQQKLLISARFVPLLSSRCSFFCTYAEKPERSVLTPERFCIVEVRLEFITINKLTKTLRFVKLSCNFVQISERFFEKLHMCRNKFRKSCICAEMTVDLTTKNLHIYKPCFYLIRKVHKNRYYTFLI